MIHLLLLVSGDHVTDRHFPLWFWNQIYLYGPGTLFTKSPLTSVTKHLPLHLFSAVQVVQPVLQKSERKSAVSFFSTTNFNWLEITAGSVYFLLRLFLPVVNWAFVFCDRRRPSCRGIAGIWTPICRWIIAAEKCTAFALSPMLRSGIFSSGKAIQGSGGRFWDMGGRWAVTYLGSSGWIEKAKTATTDVLDFSWCILSFLFCTRPVSGSQLLNSDVIKCLFKVLAD